MRQQLASFLRAGIHLTTTKARDALYAGERVRKGWRVSREIEKRSEKLLYPHLVEQWLFSQALQKKVKLRLTATALRLIDAAGGLDRYLLKTPDSQLHSDYASELKFQIGQVYKQQQALAGQPNHHLRWQQQQRQQQQQQQQQQQPPAESKEQQQQQQQQQ